MNPLRNTRDYGYEKEQAMPMTPYYDDPQGLFKPLKTKIVIPEDYDSPIMEETVPDLPEVNPVPEMLNAPEIPQGTPETSPSLRCPFCGGSNSFRPESIDKCENFSCPTCAGNVPSSTVMKYADNQYVSSIEDIEDTDELSLIKDVKDSFKTVKKMDTDK